ncbi:MAG: efflux RND transporter periplasmic adaptor subunit [Planctomycetaceae bacterium]|nr:efflux RND transporter periplasmic adaptor subunit [Planctomycetaceae bacterium]
MKKETGNLIGLIVITISAAIIMLTTAVGVGWVGGRSSQQSVERTIPPTPVAVLTAHPEHIEITQSYAGMLRPFERYALGFEIAGRIENFGQNSDGKSLDDGDYVTAGQEIARLDQRLLNVQMREARAKLEQAQSDMNRANELRGRAVGAMTEAEFQKNVTNLQLAQAAEQMISERLRDSLLVAPVAGVISKRLANVGETVSAHQKIFEIVEVDRMLLAVGVPESRVSEIRPGQRVHVEFLAKDKFGQKPPAIEGEVYLVAQTADDRTGLFEVEVVIPNPDRRLRPGLVAMSRIVIDAIDGYRLPLVTAVQRDGKMMLFSVDPQNKAHSFQLDRWIAQGPDLILPSLPAEHHRVVVRGQHRLIDGREVAIRESTDAKSAEVLQADLSLPLEKAGARP